MAITRKLTGRVRFRQGVETKWFGLKKLAVVVLQVEVNVVGQVAHYGSSPQDYRHLDYDELIWRDARVEDLTEIKLEKLNNE